MMGTGPMCRDDKTCDTSQVENSQSANIIANKNRQPATVAGFGSGALQGQAENNDELLRLYRDYVESLRQNSELRFEIERLKAAMEKLSQKIKNG